MLTVDGAPNADPPATCAKPVPPGRTWRKLPD